MKLKSTIGVISIATWALLAAQSQAEQPDLADVPLFIGNAVDPNLMFMIDDSGSMAWSFMPDGISGVCNNNTGVNDRARGRSPDYNAVYFDPDVVYEAPKKADGTQLPDADFANAWFDGYAQTDQRDLAESFRATWYYTWSGDSSNCGAAGPADYYLYDPDSACSTDSAPNLNKPACYTRYVVDDQIDAIQQSFANWYSYYRNRMFASRAAIGAAFSELPSNFRMGWGRINSGSKTVDDANSIRSVEEGVRVYDDTRKQDFYDWLYQVAPSGGTPLRRALEGAGRYFELSDQAWTDDPSLPEAASTNDMRSCRQTFTIMMSDGYYNGGDPNSAANRSVNKVGPSISSSDGSTIYQYQPADPFQYGSTTTPNKNPTLADVAMHYWKRDLKTTLENNVPTKTDGTLQQQSTAFWQNMSTYFIGLGVTGTVDVNDAWDAVKNGQSIDWWGGNYYEDRINDMLHGGIVSQGGFFTAQNPVEFAQNLESTIGDVVNRAATAAAIDFETSSTQVGSLAFSAQFDPNGWSGDLKAIAINDVDPPVIPDFDSEIANGNGWSARSLLNNRDLSSDPRQIVTYQPTNGRGQAFNWDSYSSLTAKQKGDLSFGAADDTLIENRVNYIRGDRSKRNEPEFHPREHRLGSIVNSSPHFVGTPASNWPNVTNLGNGNPYSAFRKNNSSRLPVVYVGSNDGMLHAFEAKEDVATGGRELFAYIPSFIYSDQAGEGLHYLTEPNYQHRYYVDLETRSQDIHVRGRTAAAGNPTSGKSWRTVLIGGARSGGKGLFALDITDPSKFDDEANAKELVLWEFTAADDDRLGYSIKPPSIALARWGTSDIRWTAFVSNGYNSTTDTTGFFMLDMEGGLDGTWTENTDYKYIEFEAGGDGLSPLIELDMVGDYVADRVYAGDLDGNIWVATGGTDGTWTSAYLTGSAPEPLFEGSRPITGVPAVTANYDVLSTTANRPNVLVYFGTGQYLEMNDIGSGDQDYIFGVWDSGASGLDINDLEPRSFTESTETSNDGTSYQIRRSAGDVIDYTSEYGWYIPLPDSGERVTGDPLPRFISEDLSKGVVYFNSLVPDTDPCAGGGTGWILAVGFDGTSPDEDAFVDFSDLNDPVAGFQVPGIPNEPTVWGDYLITPLTDGSTTTTPLPPVVLPGVGRRGWQELF